MVKISERKEVSEVDTGDLEEVGYTRQGTLYIKQSSNSTHYLITVDGQKVKKDRINIELKSLDSDSANDTLQDLRDRAGN